LGLLDRNDLVALTREAAEVTGSLEGSTNTLRRLHENAKGQMAEACP